MHRNSTGSGFGWVAALACGRAILFSALAVVQGALAQTQQPAAGQAPARDPYQRSSDIYRYETAGKSGPVRGEAIYYYKCWICHNQLTTTGGPHLKGLFGRQTLASNGQPVNDQTVREKIRTGGPRMPAFNATLPDADLADLISYLKDSKCCFEGDEPPPNPRYRAR